MANLLMDSFRISRRNFLQTLLAGGLLRGLGSPKPAFSQAPAKDLTEDHARGTRLDDGRPSATALAAALLRAAHQLLDRPRILEDPLAIRILGSERASALRSYPERYAVRRTLRAFIVLRSRYAEDELARAVQRGVRQYVILGAGLDTFPYRNPYPASQLRVYEVDHPATQSWKRRQLHQAEIVFDYSVSPSQLPESQRSAHESAAKRVAALGEPWITYLDPSTFAVELREMGFGMLETIDPEEANRRYFKDRLDGLQIGGSARLLKARVC